MSDVTDKVYAVEQSDRWDDKVVKVPGGRHYWVGAITTTGYGRVWVGGKSVAAHREAWRRAHGSLPAEGLVVRHSCDETSCVRPDHLEVGTPAENTRDLLSRGRWAGRGRRVGAADTRGPAGRARAIREALLKHGPDATVLSGVFAEGDPRAQQPALF